MLRTLSTCAAAAGEPFHLAREALGAITDPRTRALAYVASFFDTDAPLEASLRCVGEVISEIYEAAGVKGEHDDIARALKIRVTSAANGVIEGPPQSAIKPALMRAIPLAPLPPAPLPPQTKGQDDNK